MYHIVSGNAQKSTKIIQMVSVNIPKFISKWRYIDIKINYVLKYVYVCFKTDVDLRTQRYPCAYTCHTNYVQLKQKSPVLNAINNFQTVGVSLIEFKFIISSLFVL